MMTNCTHLEDLFKGGIFYGLEKFCDATIVAEDGFEFRAHKLFLSKGSGYFRAFFRYNTGKEGDIAVLSFDKNVLENILIFLYTQEVYLDDENLAHMIIAADYLLIENLLAKCKHLALVKISIQNCVLLLVATYFVERLGIKSHCYRFVQVNFEQLVQENGSSLSELHLDCLKLLLSDDSLGVNNELTVWKAITLWIEGTDEDRLKFLPDLLPYIRLKSNDCLIPIISTHPIFRDNPFCKNINLAEFSDSISDEESGGVNMLTNRGPSKLYIFFYPNSNATFEIYITYDEQLDIWRKIGEIDTNFHTLIAINRYIFMFNTITNTMKTFDLFEKTWVKKNTLSTSRQSYHVVQSQSRIFALGGYFFMSNTHLDEIEYYSPITDSWSYSKPVPPVHICGAIVLKEMLYVIGYLENPGKIEMRALVYDIINDVWSDIETPKCFRTNFGIISYRDSLYILGGRTEDYSVTTSVEVYDPEKSTWGILPQLPFLYELPHAIVLNDKLMVYDECPASSYVPRFSPCSWNAENNIWEIESVFSPFNEIHKYQFCCIDDASILKELTKENRDPDNIWSKTPLVRY